MKRVTVFSIFILAAVVCFAVSAEADQITTIQVAPASPQEDSPVTVTLLGTGDCNSLVLDWGDQTPPYGPSPHFNFPFQIPSTHTYNNPGTYTMKVNSVNGCQGTGKTKTITVTKKITLGGGLAELCKKIDCTALLAPKITGVLFGSNFTPGGFAVIKGVNFGANQGKFRLKGSSVPAVGSQVDLTFDTNPNTCQGAIWKATLIAGCLPTNVTGVMDQNAKLNVTTANNQKSNDWDVSFIAEKDLKIILFSDSAVQVLTCGTDSNFDECNEIRPDGESPLSWKEGVGCAGLSICGRHENCWGCIGDDVGTDQYKISLKNSWFLDSFTIEKYLSSADESITGPSPGFPSGGTSWSPSFSWKVSPNDKAWYFLSVFIQGPKGIPYK